MRVGTRTVRNSLYNGLGLAWSMVVVLLTQPFIFSHLGMNHYGLWMLVSSTVAALGVLTAGMGEAAMRYLADSHNRNDLAEMNELVSTSLLAFLVLSGIGAAGLIALAPKLAEELFTIPVADQGLARQVFRLGGILLILSNTFGLLVLLMKAAQRYDVANRFRMAIGTGVALAAIFVLWAGMGLLSVMIAGLLVMAAGSIAAVEGARRLVPGLVIWPGLSGPALRRLTGFAAISVIPGIAGIAFAQFDKMFIAAVLGSGALAYYTIPLALAQQVHGVVANVAEVVFPVSSAIGSSGVQDDLERLYLLASKVTVTLGVALAIPLVILASPVLLHWMGAEVATESARVLRLQAISYFFLSSSAVPYYLLNGIGLPRVNALFSLASGSFSIILTLVLVPRFGILGAAMAGTVNGLVVLALVAYVARVILRRDALTILRRIYSGPLLAAAITGTVLLVGLAWWPGTPGPLGLALLAVGGVCLVVLLSLLLDRAQSASGQDLLTALRTVLSGWLESEQLAGTAKIDTRHPG